MKKIILILLLLPTLVIAQSAKVISIVPRCSYVANNSIIVPVDVISQNEGIIDNTLPKYLLGSIEKNDTYEIKEVKIDSNYYDIIKEDNDIYFSLKKNSKRDYKVLDKLFSLEIKIVFNDKIPNSISVLNNSIILSNNKNSCSKINNYNDDELKCKMTFLNDNNYSYIMIIGVLIIIIIVLWKRSSNNAIHKSKNK